MRIPLAIRRWWHWEVEQRWAMSRLNPKAIRPGDVYENCNYHPMVCTQNDYGDLTGVSLIDGQKRCCSVFHCGPFKMTPEQVQESITKSLVDVGLYQQLIEDSLHLSHDEGQIEDSEYREALEFVHNGFRQTP